MTNPIEQRKWRDEILKAIDFICHLKPEKARFVLEQLLAASEDGPTPARDWEINPLTTSEHIAADMRAGRFPSQSEPEVAMAEIEARERPQ